MIFKNANSKITLKDICIIEKGKQVNSEFLLDTGKYYMLNGSILPSGYLDDYNTEENTITISEGGNSCGFVKYNKEKFWCGGHCYKILNSKINNVYLYQLLKYNENKIMDLRVGSGLPNIQKKDLENFKFEIHNDINQKKIANYLNNFDKKIDLEQSKLNILNELKKGLMQNMFVQSFFVSSLFKKGLINKLFENTSLKEVHINDLGTIVTGTTPSKSNNKYWDNGNIVWVTPSDINENRDINNSLFKITEKGLKHGRFIPKDSILVTCIASIGKNAILKVDGTCNQQINAIIPNKNYNSNYIYYLMNSISNYMKSIAGTSATSIINKEEFSKITIKVHRKDQQDYIDKILSKFETKLLLENDNLVKLQELKKGLMQNMFV